MKSSKESFVSDLHRNRAAAREGPGSPKESLGSGSQC